VPQRFYVTQQAAWGPRHVYGAITRFVPPSLHALFEHVSASAEGVAGDVASTAGAHVDVAARVRASWA